MHVIPCYLALFCNRPISELFKEYLLDKDVLAKDLKLDHFIWNDKTVVELGSGLGVVSAALIHLGADVVCTDGEQSVVYQLQENLDRNFKDSSIESECTVEEMEELPEEVCFPMVSTSNDGDQQTRFPQKENIGRYDCVKHWWGNDVRAIEKSTLLKDDNDSSNSISVNFVVAADVVYGDKEDVWDALRKSIENICRIGKSTSSPTNNEESPTDNSNNGECISSDQDRTILLVAQTARYPELEKQFYKNLEDSGFTQIFRRCISRNSESVLDCSFESDACSEWEWENDFDSCDDESISMRHQLFGYLCP